MDLEAHKEQAHEAAAEWVERLLRNRQTDCRTQIEDLARWAFLAYSIDWAPHDVRQWVWPTQMLDDGEPFGGHRPWAVLLNRACKLAGAPHV